MAVQTTAANTKALDRTERVVPRHDAQREGLMWSLCLDGLYAPGMLPRPTWLFAGIFLLAACGSNTPTAGDSGTDASTDASVEAGIDAALDVPMDTGGDLGNDLAVDATTDVCPDALADGNCLTCTPGQRVCDGACVSPTDPAYGCADPSCTPCAFANATAQCGDAGRCTMGACEVGYTDCNHDPSDGCETATGSDTHNCGACGAVCAVSNATPTCVTGACAVGACASGFGDCDHMASNGCETPITADDANCGACGNHCMLAGASSHCVAGACAVVACTAPYADCNGTAADGCEVNLMTDAGNCAMCGHACAVANGTAACTTGACAVASCNTNFGDCDMNPANGCEADLRTSSAHCGACATACTYANAMGVCAMASCSMGACMAGYADCDMNPTNGCEIHTAVDVNNCGVCGNACAPPNARPGCAGGACTVAACNPGSADCDHLAADGCEVDTNDLVTDCGACGHHCVLFQAAAVCGTGVCQIAACNPGYADCNAAPADGCEINTNSDIHHCGDCGTACAFPHAATSCVSGVCTMGACAPGYADCDGVVGNGCEALLSSDPGNCGACGTVCASGICHAGGCSP